MRLGADPEIFLLDKYGTHRSVIGKIGANKWNPKQIDGMPEGFTLQEDNVALEFGVPPAATPDEFVNNIRAVMKAGLSTLPETRFSRLSCTIFPKEEMDNPSAWVFGCEPDFNAWTGEENVKPEPPHPFMRSAGGHIHVETKNDKRLMIQALDLTVGVPSVLVDSGEQRKQLYGKAGAFRPKPYGVEYRTPSNFWIFRPALIRWVWQQCQVAEDWASKGMEFAEAINAISNDVQHCINAGDKKLANKLVQDCGLCLP